MHKMREDFNGEFLDAVIKMRIFQGINDTEFKAEFEHKVDALIQEWNNHVDINQKLAREALKRERLEKKTLQPAF